MTDTPDHIEREVEENRARVESTLDALKERMSVNQLVDDLAQFVGVEDVRGVMHTAGRQVRENPIALGMIGLGLAWLAFGGGSSSRRPSSAYRSDHDMDDDRPEWSGSSTYDPYAGGSYRQEHREGMVSKVKHAVSDAASSVGSAVHSAGEKVSDAFSSTRDRASHLREDTYERAGHWRDTLSSRSGRFADRAGDWRDRASSGAYQMRDSMAYRMEQQPLLIGAAAVAVGAVIGAAMPRTQTEDHWMGRTRDQLWNEAKASSAELRERAMHAARETYDAAVDAARDEGLVPEKGETLASKLGRVAEAAASEAKAQIDPVLHPSDDKTASMSGAGSSAGTSGTGSAPGSAASTSGSTGAGIGGMGTDTSRSTKAL